MRPADPHGARFHRLPSVDQPVFPALPNIFLSSVFAGLSIAFRDAGRFFPARFIYNVSIDIADRDGALFFRRLLSADRFSERAIFLGLLQVKTARSRSRALLSRVTRAGQRRSGAFLERERLIEFLLFLKHKHEKKKPVSFPRAGLKSPRGGQSSAGSHYRRRRSRDRADARCGDTRMYCENSAA